MECISIKEARYSKGHQISLKFNTGETGEVDLCDLVHKYTLAEPGSFFTFLS
jgi:hypothetical protein